ncbi:MAG: hypothetical protein EUB_02771 [Eubacterium sp.]
MLEMIRTFSLALWVSEPLQAIVTMITIGLVCAICIDGKDEKHG